MNGKLLICLIVVSFVASSYAAGPFCSLCTKMITQEIQNHPEGFSKMTTAQLDKDMDALCDSNTSGLETSMCKNLVKQDDQKLLAALQAGKSPEAVCQDGQLC